MNPGYTASLLLLTCIILCTFGWRRQLFDRVNRLVIAMISFGWVIFLSISVQIYQTEVHGTVIWLSALAVIFLLQLHSPSGIFLNLSASFLFASVYVLLQRLIDLYPVDFLFNEFIDCNILLSFCVFLMFRDTRNQLAVISAGLAIGEPLLALFTGRTQFGMLGGVELADYWWVIFFAARILSAAAAICIQGLRRIRE